MVLTSFDDCKCFAICEGGRIKHLVLGILQMLLKVLVIGLVLLFVMMVRVVVLFLLLV